MSAASKLAAITKPIAEPRSVLGPGGNRFRVMEVSKAKREVVKMLQQNNKKVSEEAKMEKKQSRKKGGSVEAKKDKEENGNLEEKKEDCVVDNVSVQSSCCSSDSACSDKKTMMKRIVRPGSRIVKQKSGSGAVPEDGVPIAVKRCEWITQYSDPLYTQFHDEEWGVSVHEDSKLFELLVFSQALAEHSWTSILNKRELFRKHFDNFEPSSIAQYSEKKLFSLKPLLSEPKLRAIVENAKQIRKIQQEFGSFANYCWSFVSHKPIRNDFRYGRQVPAKTPKAEAMSKDMMQRGFRCVGPTVVYSFMQVAGVVNDHLLTCFRHRQCNSAQPKDEEEIVLAEVAEDTCLSHD